MKTLIDEIIDIIERQAHEQYNEFARKQLLSVVEKIKQTVEEYEPESLDFEAAVRPVLKYLCENHHPHVTVIITPTTAELLGGIKTIGRVIDYVRD